MADLRDQFLDNMEALKQEAAEKTAENLKGDKPERVNPEQFTVEVQKLFKKGWEEAGGFMGDMTAESPLFAPWSRDEYIEVRGEDPVRWGRDYWDYRKEELANAALMEAFDAQKGTIAEALMVSMVMHEKPDVTFFGRAHRTVTPAFEAEVMIEPLNVFSESVMSLSPARLAEMDVKAIEDFAKETGVHLDVAVLYRFSDGSYMVRNRHDYTALSLEEGEKLEAKLA